MFQALLTTLLEETENTQFEYFIQFITDQPLSPFTLVRLHLMSRFGLVLLGGGVHHMFELAILG